MRDVSVAISMMIPPWLTEKGFAGGNCGEGPILGVVASVGIGNCGLDCEVNGVCGDIVDVGFALAGVSGQAGIGEFDGKRVQGAYLL